MGYVEKSTKKTYEKKGRYIVAPMGKEIKKCGLDNAIQENRAPNTDELIEESKIILGKTLIGLRSADNVYKVATAISNVVKCISQISMLETVEELTPDVLKNMTNDELKDLVSKYLDKLN